MTLPRDAITQAFLAESGWGKATRARLAGDASNRRYERLILGSHNAQAVLMDAPPAHDDSVTAFLHIARHLSALGLSAPRILAEDPSQGLLLLEDLGDALFARLLENDPEQEQRLYLAATDVLLELQSQPAPAAPDFGLEAMTEAVGLAQDWYGFGMTGQSDPDGKTNTQIALTDALNALPPWQPVLVLRDYHAENLFWLHQRDGVARVGLIDFQDAVLSHPVYDLVSLAHDVRRDVAPDTITAMVARFAKGTGQDPSDIAQAAATLSAQRALRILGVFSRLSLQLGKPGYINFIPRTWNILMRDLSHPALAALRHAITTSLPEPTPILLESLKNRCGTIPVR